MAWTDLQARLNAAVFSPATLGLQVVYTCAGHGPVTVYGPFDAAAETVQLQGDVEVTGWAPRLSLALGDLPAAPLTGDLCTVAGVDYAVADVRPDGSGGVDLRLLKS